MKPTGLPSYTSFTYVLDEFPLLVSTGSCSERGGRFQIQAPSALEEDSGRNVVDRRIWGIIPYTGSIEGLNTPPTSFLFLSIAFKISKLIYIHCRNFGKCQKKHKKYP